MTFSVIERLAAEGVAILDGAAHRAASVEILDEWCAGDPGERAYEVSRTATGWLMRLRSDRNGLLTEQTEKTTKADALASAAMIVTHNPYLE